jgi:hypothetical protein
MKRRKSRLNDRPKPKKLPYLKNITYMGDLKTQDKSSPLSQCCPSSQGDDTICDEVMVFPLK